MFPIRLLLSVVLLSALASQAWALRSDRKQPIDIKANRVEVDQKTQTSHYIGNVHLVQGTLKISADDVMVYMVNGQLYKIVITGNPAHFQQQPENQKDVVTAQAQNMEYFANKERLLLRHHAQVNQGPNHFRGDFIEYDTLTSTVKAHKGENSKSRVHAIIQPGSEEGNGKPTSPSPGNSKSKAPQSAPATGKP